jgi:hypothetical protein
MASFDDGYVSGGSSQTSDAGSDDVPNLLQAELADVLNIPKNQLVAQLTAATFASVPQTQSDERPLVLLRPKQTPGTDLNIGAVETYENDRAREIAGNVSDWTSKMKTDPSFVPKTLMARARLRLLLPDEEESEVMVEASIDENLAKSIVAAMEEVDEADRLSEHADDTSSEIAWNLTQEEYKIAITSASAASREVPLDVHLIIRYDLELAPQTDGPSGTEATPGDTTTGSGD